MTERRAADVDVGLVLVAHEDAGAGERLRMGLERACDHLRTVRATTADAGLDLVEAGEVDCVVAAPELADVDGASFLRAVGETDPSVPLVLLCPDGERRVADDGDRLATDASLEWSRPDDVGALAARVEAVIGGDALVERARERERFEKLINHSTDVVFVVDENGVYRYVSPAVERVLGYEPEALVGTNGFDLVHPDDVEAAMEEFFAAVEDPSHRPMVEFRAEHRDGSWRWLEVRGRNLLDDPDIAGFVVNARDVTDRRAFERRLARQERRFRQIAEHLPETIIWMTDVTFSEVLYVSPGYEDLWGRPVDELYDDPGSFFEPVHPDDREAVREGMAALVEAAVAGEAPALDRIVYRVVRPDDTVCWVQGKTVPLTDDDGTVVRWVGLAIDVTARRMRERELERVETLLQTVPDGVFLVDENGVMHHVNDAWAEMLDLDPDDLEGAPFADLVGAGLVDETLTERYDELLRELLSSDADREQGVLEVEADLPGRDPSVRGPHRPAPVRGGLPRERGGGAGRHGGERGLSAADVGSPSE